MHSHSLPLIYCVSRLILVAHCWGFRRRGCILVLASPLIFVLLRVKYCQALKLRGVHLGGGHWKKNAKPCVVVVVVFFHVVLFLTIK